MESGVISQEGQMGAGSQSRAGEGMLLERGLWLSCGRKQEDEDIKGRVVGLEIWREGQVQRGQKAGHGGPCRHGQILGLSFKKY